MLAGTVVYVYAGTQLARITSLKGILSPGLLGAFVLLGLFPFIAKRILAALKARKVYAKWTKPARFDRNVVVIGAGSAGLVTSYIAAAVKAKVTLVERHRMGGDCLNTGCVPSKALIRSAKFLSHVRRAKEFGIRGATADFDFADVMERVQSVVKADRAARLRRALHGARRGRGAPARRASAPLDGRDREGRTARRRQLTTRNIVIAAGARPFVPPIPGLAEATAPHVRHRVGAAQAAGAPGGAGRRPDRLRARAGLRALRLAGDAGGDAAAAHDPRGPGSLRRWCSRSFEADGVDVLVGHKAKQVVDGGRREVPRRGGRGRREAHRLRRDPRAPWAAWPTPTGYGLEELGIPVTKGRTVEVNEFLETALPQHLRLRRRRRPLPVHAHRGAHGLVRVGERAVRALPQVPRGLFGDPLGHVHRARGGARGAERDRRRRRRASRTRSSPTASTTSTARSPTARRTAS